MFKSVYLLLLCYLQLAAVQVQTSVQEYLTNKKISYKKTEHTGFKEYYELRIEQPIDHNNKNAGTFFQKVILGYNDSATPVVMETEGYALNRIFKPSYINTCNVIAIEHRYYGASVPKQIDWTYLTIKQAAEDCHEIRNLFDSLFTGKWLTTGISKGGQTALAYRMFYPEDADATLAYVTPVKQGQTDQRLTEKFRELSHNETGKQVFSFQRFAFRHKQALLPLFTEYVNQKGYNFGDMTHEQVLDYMLLEYPFSFFQNCHSISVIPDSATLHSQSFIIQLTGVVPAVFYTEEFRKKLQPSFYMFYHELGYYEYDKQPFKAYLKLSDYSNSFFAPNKPVFDTQYLQQLYEFMSSGKATQIIFIYGEFDPYTAFQADVSKCQDCLKFIIKEGCHKSRIHHLDSSQKQQVFSSLSKWLYWNVHD